MYLNIMFNVGWEIYDVFHVVKKSLGNYEKSGRFRKTAGRKKKWEQKKKKEKMKKVRVRGEEDKRVRKSEVGGEGNKFDSEESE